MDTIPHSHAAAERSDRTVTFGLPLIGLRGISDGAAPLSGFMDWTRYLAEIDLRLAAAVDLLSAAVAEGLLG